MTGILAAALAVAWLAIVLLGLGYAGLVGQVRELQSRRAATDVQKYPDLAAPSAGTRSVVLALSRSCGTCETVLDAWLDLAARLTVAGHRPVLVSLDGDTQWLNLPGAWTFGRRDANDGERGAPEVLTAEELSAPFLIAYQPALLIVDGAGTLVSAEPIGSAESLRAACESLTAPAGQPATAGV
jgi:hypothetical protein